MPWIVQPCSTAPAQRATVRCDMTQSFQPSDRRTQDRDPCKMAALYIRSGTVPEIVCERLSALQISSMHLEDGARPVSAASTVTGLNWARRLSGWGSYDRSAL